jgi:hypothetical protein
VLFNDLNLFDSKLYTGVQRSDSAGGEIWRSSNGSIWDKVVDNGFGDSSNSEIYILQDFDGMIYAGSWVNSSSSHGAEVWRSSTGDSGSWTRVVQDGFNNDSNNRGIQSSDIHNNTLFLSTGNWTTGSELWSTTNGTAWVQVNSDGFGDMYNTRSILKSFGGYLYAGTNYSSSGDPGCELWRCQVCDGTDWTQVPGTKGFGDPDNSYIQHLAVYRNMLYAFVWNDVSGVQVWITPNGLDWNKIDPDGLGDSNNLTVYQASAEFMDKLYIGIRNRGHGTEIWQMDASFLYLPAVKKE